MFEKKVTDEEKKRLEREAKRRKKEESNGNSKTKEKVIMVLKNLVIPILLAGAIALGLYIAIEEKVAADQLKTSVVISVKEIPANTLVKQEDISKYFAEYKVELEAVSDNTYKKLSDLPDKDFYVEDALKPSQMVYKENLATVDTVMDKYKSGYQITSFSVEHFDGGVNGSIRKGDIVDIYALDEVTDLLVLMAEDVYVSEVYDNAGNKISSKDEVATSFTIYVTPEEVESINLAVTYGGIQMYKVE